MPTTQYIYLGHQYLCEADETGTLTKRCVNEPGTYTNLVSRKDLTTGETSYPLYDALGSTRSVTDESGDVTDTFVYDAWGNVLDRTGTTELPFQYVGKHGYYHDEETGLSYVMARIYDPRIVRWLSVDPSETVNSLYLYTLSSPLTFYDLSGLFPVMASGAFSSDDNHKDRDAICESAKKSGFLAITICAVDGVKLYNCDEDCTAICMQLHEEQHKSDYLNKDHSLGKCCMSLQASAANLQKDEQQFFYDEFNKWIKTNLNALECPGYRKEYECLVKLRLCIVTEWRGDECRDLRIKLKKLRPSLFDGDTLIDANACMKSATDRRSVTLEYAKKHCDGKATPDPNEKPPIFTNCPDFMPGDECR